MVACGFVAHDYADVGAQETGEIGSGVADVDVLGPGTAGYGSGGEFAEHDVHGFEFVFGC